jgi:HEAT repeat protein
VRVIRNLIFVVLVAAFLAASVVTISSGGENLGLMAATALLAVMGFPQTYEWLNDRLGPARDLRAKAGQRPSQPGTVEEYLHGRRRAFADEERRFVPLALAVQPEYQSGEAAPTDDLEALFAQHGGRFVLVGDPGAGKSTSLRALMRGAITRYLGNPSDYPIPVWINLGEGANPIDADGLLQHWWESRCYLPDSAEKAIRQNHLLLFLDGLNEMPLDSREERAKALRDFLERNRDVPVVVTCRVRDYEDDDAVNLPLAVVKVLPLDEGRIQQFIERNGGDGKLWAAIQADEALQTLAANPYNLYQLIQIAVEQARKGETEPLPRDLNQLYRRYLSVTYNRYKREREQQHDPLTPLVRLPLKTLEKRLGRLGFAMLAEGKGTSAEVEWALDWRRRWKWGGQAIRDGLNLGVLLGDGENLRFYHGSLQGYFAVEPLRRAVVGHRIFRQYAKEENLVKIIRQVGYLGPAGAPLTNLLIDALENNLPMVRVAAMSTLFLIGEPVVEPLTRTLLDTGWPHLVKPHEARVQRDYVIKMLAGLAAVAVPPLIRILVGRESDTRRMAAALLGRIGEPATESLVSTLNNPDPEVRFLATYALCNIGDSRATMPLAAVLNDPDKDTRIGAILALGATKDPKAVEPLIRVMKDTDAQIRGATVVALGEIRNPTASDSLARALNDADPDVRYKSAMALGKIGDPRAIEPLIHVLGNPSFEIQQEAVDLLYHLGEAAIDPLINTLSTSGEQTVMNSIVALCLLSRYPRAKLTLDQVAAVNPELVRVGTFAAELHKSRESLLSFRQALDAVKEAKKI